ncbi:hypothetical protein [Goodfellowiella coeruleoviolacea]|uniref:Uncharacterized protein n=1 Tax=Goodfellowiella coeruleoviolacea TaxID=334858 RepID=A0AAE3KJ83_9PSEU|nr:hypothetical protein [Goodfellowiella coeruleoviolacea]MCP2168154.1 hypothetical protein [Goodfellowiella coeruleoviolacea]
MPRTAPPRTYSPADVLSAVARMLKAQRPGGIGLAAPTDVRTLTGSEALPELAMPSTRALIQWAEALTDTTLTVTGWLGGTIHVRAVGRIPRGPRVAVTAWVDADLGLAVDETRTAALGELRQLAE